MLPPQRIIITNNTASSWNIWGPWVGLLAERLTSQAQTSLYRFLGNFLNLFLELEGNLHFREVGVPDAVTGRDRCQPEHGVGR